jgi:hypothetical protein
MRTKRIRPTYLRPQQPVDREWRWERKVPRIRVAQPEPPETQPREWGLQEVEVRQPSALALWPVEEAAAELGAADRKEVHGLIEVDSLAPATCAVQTTRMHTCNTSQVSPCPRKEPSFRVRTYCRASTTNASDRHRRTDHPIRPSDLRPSGHTSATEKYPQREVLLNK